MKAYEFPGHVTADGKLELPDFELPKLQHNQDVRVLVLVNEPETEKADWQELTTTQFLDGYSSVDAIYDEC